ncbi:hypothetical protein SLS62_004179 [Diatrype stigma]|uniref:Major facilitator superfamily (MFS) profile domain-containing protein n=1 Tax=Diatrype stigma TaxID=117547 RepID=A0AAN9YPE3_9PEZI
MTSRDITQSEASETQRSHVDSNARNVAEKPLMDYGSDAVETQGFDAQATKRLLRKVDWTLVPFLALLYLLSFLDRTNIGNARLAGLEEDLANLGYTAHTAQLMTVPPYVVACLFCIGAGFLADRWRQRGIFMIFFNLVGIIGFVMQIATTNNAIKYAGTFFAASGVSAAASPKIWQ